LADEVVKRRTSFSDGMKIRLADGQLWTFPAPTNVPDSEIASFGSEYPGLIQAIMEAESDSGRGLAELSFAIFLLGYNYCLSSADYVQLLSFAPGSQELNNWQSAFRSVADEHLHCFGARSEDSMESRQLRSSPRRSPRVLVWLRNHLPSWWWSFNSWA
jgi:hypothetical protein